MKEKKANQKYPFTYHKAKLSRHVIPIASSDINLTWYFTLYQIDSIALHYHVGLPSIYKMVLANNYIRCNPDYQAPSKEMLGPF